MNVGNSKNPVQQAPQAIAGDAMVHTSLFVCPYMFAYLQGT